MGDLQRALWSVLLGGLVAALGASALTPSASAYHNALGGVQTDSWCQANGYVHAGYTGPAQGPGAAYSWYCESSDGFRPELNFNAACRSQHSDARAFARPTNVDDVFSWLCYAGDYDEYEPNNSRGAASKIPSGIGAEGVIDRAGDRDWFFQRVRPGQRFTVKVSGFPGYPEFGHNVSVEVYKKRQQLDSDNVAYGSPFKLTRRLHGNRAARIYVGLRSGCSPACVQGTYQLSR